jgi:hypothetical protein
MPRGREYSRLKRTGERLSEAARRDFRAFSPSPALAVDFGDSAVAQKFVDSVDLGRKVLKWSRKYFWGGGAIRLDLQSRAVVLALAN